MENSLTPPERFGIIAPQVYRSSVFHPVNFPFINGLKLKTIVHLSPEVTLRAVSSFIRDNDIQLIHLGIKFWKPAGQSWRPMSEELVKEALELLLDQRNHPLMLMCTSGVHQTGTVVGCLRKLQNLSFTGIVDEMRRFAFPTHTRYANENFVEFFDIDLVSLPENLPAWFVFHQRRLTDEPALEIKEDQEYKGGVVPAYLRHFHSKNGPLVENWLKDSDRDIDSLIVTGQMFSNFASEHEDENKISKKLLIIENSM